TVTASAPAGPPAGQVTFYLCTNTACATSVPLGPAAALNGSAQASLSVPGLPGGSYPVFARFTPSDATSYAASTSASITQVVGFSSPCITSTVPGLTVAAGQSVCVSAPGKVSGSVTVNSGGALSLDGASVGGSVTATGATALR